MEQQDVSIEDIFELALSKVAGGRVLDIATGEGGFVRILAQNLKSYAQIIGVDASERAIKTAQNAFSQENIRFIPMDAEQLSFDDESFDTLSISASLHHLGDIPQVLAEARRVLKPGGHFIVAEMHRDAQTEAQLSIVYLHHWVAQVDTALGIPHNSTLTRQELFDYVVSLDLYNVTCYDFSDTASDPMDETKIMELESLIDRTIARAKGVSNYAVLKQRGEQVRQRLWDVGVQREPVIVITGERR